MTIERAGRVRPATAGRKSRTALGPPNRVTMYEGGRFGWPSQGVGPDWPAVGAVMAVAEAEVVGHCEAEDGQDQLAGTLGPPLSVHPAFGGSPGPATAAPRARASFQAVRGRIG